MLRVGRLCRGHERGGKSGVERLSWARRHDLMDDDDDGNVNGHGGRNWVYCPWCGTKVCLDDQTLGAGSTIVSPTAGTRVEYKAQLGLSGPSIRRSEIRRPACRSPFGLSEAIR
jgi:hypothetical protein